MLAMVKWLPGRGTGQCITCPESAAETNGAIVGADEIGRDH